MNNIIQIKNFAITLFDFQLSKPNLTHPQSKQ